MRAGLLFLFFTGLFAESAFADSDELFYQMRQDWSESTGSTNISIFTFNDLNGNGIYDLGDRAFAGVATGLRRNGAPVYTARTNINGFANYPASLSAAHAPLSEAGPYEFEVFTPPGWRITTQNRAQSRNLVRVEGSNSGVGLAEMLHPVGVARYLFIRGTYDMPEAGDLVLYQESKVIARASLTPGEQFLMPVNGGHYSLESAGTRRLVRVTTLPVDIGKINKAPLSEQEGRLIDFENMAPSGLQKAPNGYGGLGWFNLNIMTAFSTSRGFGYLNGATSGANILYNSSGHAATISSGTPFDFISANLSVAWPKAEGEDVEFRFFRGDDLVLRDNIVLSAYGPVEYHPQIAGITRVEIATMHNWQLVIDDLRVSTE